MRVTIKPIIFVVLLVTFYCFGGFQRPHAASGSVWLQRQVSKASDGFALLFVVGAAVAVFGKQSIGSTHPTSLRGVYIFLGSICMLIALAWVITFKGTVRQ